MNNELYNQALDGRMLYKMGRISRAEAKEMIMPYAEKFNEVSERLAKKYNQKPKRFNFNAFIR